MVTKAESLLEFTEYTDPYCTWCWGSEPVLRRIQEVFGEQIGINYKMGGLVADITRFHDAVNGIGGADWHARLAEHWREASERHGMPVDEQVWYEIKDEFRSTYPANIAFKSAEFQDARLAKKFLRKMREAAAAERMAIHRQDVQAALAQEVGLECEQLIDDIQSGRAASAFQADLRDVRAQGISSFPTFVVKNRAGQEVRLQGYVHFERFEKVFRELSGDALDPNSIDVTEQNIIMFIRKHERVAPVEVAKVFGESGVEWLQKLEKSGRLQKSRAGNGFFIRHGKVVSCATQR